MLELYQFEECPFSAHVRAKMSEWEMDYILRNVPKDKLQRHRLKKVSGQNGVPTLVDSLRDVVIAGNEKKIVAYLRSHYRSQAKH